MDSIMDITMIVLDDCTKFFFFFVKLFIYKYKVYSVIFYPQSLHSIGYHSKPTAPLFLTPYLVKTQN